MPQVLMGDVLFRTIFNHIFVRSQTSPIHHVGAEGSNSLKFESMGAYCFISIRFWKEDNICVVKLFRYRLACEPIAGLPNAIYRLLSVLSARQQIVSVSGCPPEVLPLLERSSYFDKGIQYPFKFDAFSLPRLMHQRWDCVFGGVSFFLRLPLLVTFLDGCQNHVLFTSTPELCRGGTLHYFSTHY